MRLADYPLAAHIITALMLGAVLWPMVGEKPKDSFPLSTFPMFSRKRPAKVEIDHVVMVDNNGATVVVPPKWVAGSEVLQTKAAIAHAVNRGKKARAKLCTDVATRLAEDGGFDHILRIEIRRDRFHVARYFSDGPKPLHSHVFARCSLPRQLQEATDGGA